MEGIFITALAGSPSSRANSGPYVTNTDCSTACPPQIRKRWPQSPFIGEKSNVSRKGMQSFPQVFRYQCSIVDWTSSGSLERPGRAGGGTRLSSVGRPSNAVLPEKKRRSPLEYPLNSKFSVAVAHCRRRCVRTGTSRSHDSDYRGIAGISQ